MLVILDYNTKFFLKRGMMLYVSGLEGVCFGLGHGELEMKN